MKIGIIVITTGLYKQFAQPLIKSIDDYFLPGHDKTIFLFTDEQQELKSCSTIKQIIIPPFKFPEVTLRRYWMITSSSELMKECSHLFYLDADSLVVSVVGDEILVDGLLATSHPGYHVSKLWGDSNNPETSTSFLPTELRKQYVCGGFQGGECKVYIDVAEMLAINIATDVKNGVQAIHHDETHWNFCVHHATNVTILDPSYMMVQQTHLRKLWGIDNFAPKILALEKNHNEIRQ